MYFSLSEICFISLYLQLSPQPYCQQDQVINEKFENYYDCITKGYLYSYRHLTEMYDKDEVEENKMAIKFQCRDFTKGI